MNPETADRFTITLLGASDVPSVLLCLAGEIDMAAAATLAEVTDRLSAAAPASVVIDLAEVTFTCSTMPNFLAHLRRSLPAASSIMVCRPAPGIRWLLLETGMDRIVTLRADLPSVVRSPPVGQVRVPSPRRSFHSWRR